MIRKLYSLFLAFLAIGTIISTIYVSYVQEETIAIIAFLSFSGLLLLGVTLGIIIFVVQKISITTKERQEIIYRKNKHEFHISFYDESGKLITEYIPPPTSRFDYFVKVILLDLSRRLGRQEYYWQYRFFLEPKTRKIEDIKFLVHAYTEHDMQPEDKREARHLAKAYTLYYDEFLELLAPRIELEKKGKGVENAYARAYFKNWMKDPDPSMKQFYHGVEPYERIELLEKLFHTDMKNIVNHMQRVNYHNRKVKKKQ